MNERIGKLAVEAGAHWEHGDWNMPSAVYFSERELEKFAELIVREYIDIIAPYTVRMSRPGEEYLHPILEIKQHFGVEE